MEKEEVYKQVYNELINAQKRNIILYRTGAITSACGSVLLGYVSYLNADNFVGKGAGFLAGFLGVNLIVALLGYRKIIKETKAHAEVISNTVYSTMNSLQDFIGGIFGGAVMCDGINFKAEYVPFERKEESDVIDVDYEVVEDDLAQMPESETLSKAKALEHYIIDVHYSGYELDLIYLQGIINNIMSANSIEALASYEEALEQMADKAYNAALECYGMGR